MFALQSWVEKVLSTVLLTLLLTACGGKGASAQSLGGKPDLHKDIGFYSMSESWVPSTVREAAPYVVQLRVLAIPDEHSATVADVSHGKGKVGIEKIRNLKATDSFDELDKSIVVAQVEACERYKSVRDQKQCVISLVHVRGTGFIAGDERTIWTNAHVVEYFLNTIAKYDNMSVTEQLKIKRPLRIFVFDQHGRMIVNPFEDKVVPKIIPEQTAEAKLHNTFFADDSDYMALSVDRAIGRPLPVAKQPAKVGERIYILGYPHCTGCDLSNIDSSELDLLDFKDRSPKPNATGQGLELTSGSVLNFDSLQFFFGLPLSFFKDWRLNDMIFVSADSTDGSSGSPILNGSGEVVGILAGSKSRMIDNQLVRVTRGVVPAALFNP